MALVELLQREELAEIPKKRVLVIGSNWEDRRNEVTDKLAEFFRENDLPAEVEIVINSVNIENAISGKVPGGPIEKVAAVLLGTHARQYDKMTGMGMTLDVEESGLIDKVREWCQENEAFLGRFRRNVDGTFDFWEDGKSPEESKLLNP